MSLRDDLRDSYRDSPMDRTLGRAGVFASTVCSADQELVTRIRLVSLEHIIVGEMPVLHNHTFRAVRRPADVRVVILVRGCVYSWIALVMRLVIERVMVVVPRRPRNCKLLGLSIKDEGFVSSCEVLGHGHSRMLRRSNIRRMRQLILLTP